MPYTTNYRGFGPAWGNSLFEDNAEHGLGMFLGYKQLRSRAKMLVEETVANTASEDLKAAAQAWIDGYNSAEKANHTHAPSRGDGIQPSHALSSSSPPALNPSQHQSLFQ